MKAKEFLNKMVSDVSQSQKPLISMNHKTLEDVKREAMLKSMYIKYRGVVIYMEELDKILENTKL